MLNEKIPKYAAEAVGAFCLVFAGTSAVVVEQTTGRLGGVGVSLVFGLIVLAMIYAVGHISGAHLNPAVSLGFYSAGRLPAAELAPYLLAQFGGAISASLLVRLIFWGVETDLGMTLPAGSWQQSFALEFVLSFILLFVVMAVATDHRAQGVMAGVAVGATIAVEALVGGPVSGASMNPARSLAPALLAANFDRQWLYVVAPLLGGVLGARAYLAVQCESPGKDGGPGCC